MKSSTAIASFSLAAVACLAGSASAQFDPHTLAELGLVAPEHVPLPHFDVRLDARGMPQPFVEASKRAAFTPAQRRLRQRELERLALDVPMLRSEEHELFA